MYIFLDFDGVLRRLSSDPGKFEEDLLSNFENMIRKHEHLKIVITSTWRLVYSLSEILISWRNGLGKCKDVTIGSE